MPVKQETQAKREIDAIYNDFLIKLKTIEKECAEEIKEILNREDREKIKNILKDIKAGKK